MVLNTNLQWYLGGGRRKEGSRGGEGEGGGGRGGEEARRGRGRGRAREPTIHVKIPTSKRI